MNPRPLAVAAALIASLGVLSACSDDAAETADSAETAVSASDSPSGSPADEPAEGEQGDGEDREPWNPCDGLKVGRLAAVLGTDLEVDRGTEEAPRCALIPATEGGTVLDANYTVFADGLDAAWETMGAPDDGTVTSPRIPGADAARLVVSATDEGVTATGFVQNGSLIHVVNAADTAPYDRGTVVEGVTTAMTQLSNASTRAARLQAP